MPLLNFKRGQEPPSEYRRLVSMVDLGLQEVNSAGVILSSFNRYQRAACLHLVRAAQILEELEKRLPDPRPPNRHRNHGTVGETALHRRIPERHLGIWTEYLPEIKSLAQQPPHEQPQYSQDVEHAVRRIQAILEDTYYEIARELQRVRKPLPLRWLPLLAVFALVAVVGVASWRELDPDLTAWLKAMGQTHEAVLREVPATALSQIKEAGTPWNRTGNVLIPQDPGGLTVKFGTLQHASSLEISLDNNDNYRLYFMRGNITVSDATITSNTQNPGLQIYTVSIPQNAAARGFDKVRIVAIQGDGSYSVGHLVLR